MGCSPHTGPDESSPGEQAGMITEIEWEVSGRPLAVGAAKISCTRSFHGHLSVDLPDFFRGPFRTLANGISARMVVPRSGADSTQKVPPTISTRSLMPSNPKCSL